MEYKDLSGFRETMNRMAANAESFLFILDFSLKNALIFPTAECKSQNIFYELEGLSNFTKESSCSEIEVIKHPVSYAEYLKAFQQVQKEIHQGNSYLVNLTFPTPIDANANLNDIFQASSSRYKLLYKDKFLVFSPECFVKIANGKICTFPMKGTIDASLENAEEILLKNDKETAEHATIVDLLRNDLSRIASNVKVEKFRYIEKITTSGKDLLQMSSLVSGDLPADYISKIGDILIELLPAGSICGAPKKATLKIIEDTEQYNRDFYTGVFGIFDGENLNSGVMIRFIENQNGQLVYKSGGGITAMSDPAEEYQELIDKIYVPLA